MKLVSISTRYGGTSSALCARKREDAICGLHRLSKNTGAWMVIRQPTRDELLLLSPLLPFSFALIGSPSCQDIVDIRRLLKQERNGHTSGRHWDLVVA